MNTSQPGQFKFDGIHNFRDLGGYGTRDGYTVARSRIFRSGELHGMTPDDLKNLKDNIRLRSILDLRSEFEISQTESGLIPESGFNYFNVPLITDGGDIESNKRRYHGLDNMGEFYVSLSKQDYFPPRLIEALNIIADPANHPVVFHCSAGKDRTGILAAILLAILGVNDSDIAKDYTLTASHPEKQYNNVSIETLQEGRRNGLPAYFWKIEPGLILYFLENIRGEYGSIEGYVYAQGGDNPLIDRLRTSLLR